MKLRSRKFWGTVMAVVMVMTSFSFTGKNEAKADVAADVNIVYNGDNQVINALKNTTATIDGVAYNNYTSFNGMTVEADSGANSAKDAVDRNTGSRWESQHGVDNISITIELGNVYSIDAFAAFWEDASAKDYILQTSVDGVDYTDIKEVNSTVHKRTDWIKFAEPVKARYIRVFCKQRNTAYGYSIYEMAVYGAEAQKPVVKNLSNFKVTSYAKYTGKYMLYFNEASESEGYRIYIDDAAEPVKTIRSSGAYLTNDELAGYADGEHTAYIANVLTVDGVKTESGKLGYKFTKEATVGRHGEMPQVYIYGKNITNDYHQSADFAVSVIDADGGSKGWGITDDKGTTSDKTPFSRYSDIIDSECNMKIRGNTTAGQPKKGWNIKFSSKTTFLGMPKGKKWNLLAGSMDKSLVRDYLSYNFALENGVKYTSQSRFAEVYLNGKFVGNYQICEPVEAKTNRVEIDAYNGENNDILLELGTRNESGVDHFTTNVLNTTFDVNDPEKDDDLANDLVDAKIVRVKSYLNSFENALKTHDMAQIEQFIDVNSFVDFYVVNELFKNQDFNFSSTRFYIKDGVIYAGPIWDLDLSSGNIKSSYYTGSYVDGDSAKGYNCKSMTWYKELFKTNGFETLVKNRYEALQYKIQSLYRTDSTETLSINYLINKYGASFNRNYDSEENLGAGWPVHYEDGYSYAAESDWKTWSDAVEFLRAWLVRRNTWLCDQYGIDMEAAYVASQQPEETTTATPTTKTKTTKAETTKAEMTKVETTAQPGTEASTATPGTQATTADGQTNVTTESNTGTSSGQTPEAPTGLVRYVDHIYWSPAANAVSYNIYDNGRLVGNTTGTDYVISLPAGGSKTIMVKSVSASGVESQAGATIQVSVSGQTGQTARSTEEPTASPAVTLAKVKITKATKKKASKKLSLKIKTVRNVTGYYVTVFKTKKKASKYKGAIFKKHIEKDVAKFTVTSAKLKGKKTLYVRVRPYAKLDGKYYYGKLSDVKKVKIK